MDLTQIRSIKNPELTIPSFKGELRAFQKAGVIAAYLHPRIIIGDDTGLGKTVQSVALLNYLSDLGELPLNKTMVLCSNSMQEDWFRAFKKFTPLKPVIFWTSDRDGKCLHVKNHALVLGYSTLLSRISYLRTVGFQNIIIDEASYIKNVESKTFGAARELVDKANRVVVLNATSIENGLQDAYSMGELLEHGFFGNYEDYIMTYCETEKRYYRTRYHTLKYDLVIKGAKSLQSIRDLKTKLSKYYFRRTYSDVEIQMPEEVVHTIPVHLKAGQKKEYIEQVELFEKRKIKGSLLLYNLLRICDGKMRRWAEEEDPEKISAKGEAILELVQSFNEPFIFYSTYLDPLLAVAKILKNAGKKVGFYTGKNKDTRDRHSDAFKEGKLDCLGITMAGARGKNWPEARHLIEINSVYNPSLEHQIRSRIKRMDSTFKSVCIHKFYAEDTVEENVLAHVKRKGALANYMNENGTGLEHLSDEDVRQLLTMRVSLIDKEALLENVDSLKEN
ncbi:RNA polymerase-associated protein RapA [uncultured archaeon]|nr:RNA polymerase-associated protein RapA [uncultured archaeon]